MKGNIINKLSVFAVFSLLFISCNSDLRLTILFDKASGLEKGADVILAKEKVGEVAKMELQDGKVAVHTSIYSKFRDRIKEDSKFYLLRSSGKPRIEILIFDKGSEKIKNGITVEGYPEYRYWIDKGFKKIKDEVGDFLESEEWKEFKRDFREKAEESADKSKDWLKEEAPKLREKAEEMYEKFEEEYGSEVKVKAKEFVDSLLQNFEEETENKN